ncbi:MAG TPA: M23 family metallopeptidase [Treponemataceae bacterium]|nr:M23 family metallopeptidase [Treponemataceae bacterium]
MRKKLHLLFYIIGFSYIVFSASPASNSTNIFPHIKTLGVQDPLFIQYSEDVQQNYYYLAAKKEPLVQIYTYTAKASDDLLLIAARCSMPYETIATLNRIGFLGENIVGKTLYLPTCPGVFVSKEPKTAFEIILSFSTFDTIESSCYTITNNRFDFYSNMRLDATQRAFFTDSGLRSPISKGILTSPYGYRANPITGKKQFHQGIDIAAPEGTQVFAIKNGIVMVLDWSRVYGNYIILSHDEDKTSLYAHLSKIKVRKDDVVTGGQVIGLVGSTGLSTGAHLHFEIRLNGCSENPEGVSSRFKY